MKVRDILKRKGNDVFSIDPESTVFEAIKKMSGLDVGALLVIENGKLAGIISERDYLDKIILMGRQSKTTPVKDIMTRQVFCIRPDDDIKLCMRLMTVKRIRHLPVIDGEHIEGVISIGDAVKAVIDQQKVEINSLRDYIAGGYPR